MWRCDCRYESTGDGLSSRSRDRAHRPAFKECVPRIQQSRGDYGFRFVQCGRTDDQVCQTRLAHDTWRMAALLSSGNTPLPHNPTGCTWFVTVHHGNWHVCLWVCNCYEGGSRYSWILKLQRMIKIGRSEKSVVKLYEAKPWKQLLSLEKSDVFGKLELLASN